MYLNLYRFLLQHLDQPGTITDVLSSLRTATEQASSWAKAWHQWALFNVAVMQVGGGRGGRV